MKTLIEGAPSFAYLNVELEPGESIIAESDAMVSMDSAITMKAEFNGGFFSGVLKSLFGGESLFVANYTNNTNQIKRITLVQNTPGDMREIELNNSSLILQPGAYIASSLGVKLEVRWAGFRSWIAKEGLFKLEASGKGCLWYGGYGGIIYREVRGSYLVDTSHLIAYEPHLKIKLQLAGGLFSSFFGGEGIVTRIEGDGKIALQTRSVSGLSTWINPMF